MSRKTDRLAKKATKKVNTPTVEKVEAVEESSDEEVPILEQDLEEEDIEEEDVEDLDEDEELAEEDLEEGDEDDEEEVVAKKDRALRPRINDEVKKNIFDMWDLDLNIFVGCHDSYH